jgi:DNA-binding transcriptional MerR regulator
MKISELAAQAGVPLSAVKYYQREGLLPAGEKSAPNQASYDQVHVQRVRLIRALLTTGGLSVAAAGAVITAIETASLAEAFAVAQQALSASPPDEAPPSAASRQRIVELARSQGWAVTASNPGVDAAARALDGLAAIGFAPPDAYLASYASAAATAAAADLRALAAWPDPDRIAEVMVVGTVLGDPLFAGLRRLAQEDATHNRFPLNQKER